MPHRNLKLSLFLTAVCFTNIILAATDLHCNTELADSCDESLSLLQRMKRNVRGFTSGMEEVPKIRGGASNADEIDTELLGRDLEGHVFNVDADISTLRWKPKTISVVLPCAEEREYAFKTVQSVFNNTPSDVLHEIVVVDDGSDPPLSQTHLIEDVQKRYKVKIVRHEKTEGLIRAKKDGGDAATGDILVFLDCHVAPQAGWHQDFLKLIGQNWRRMVVPQIGVLDIDTWTQASRMGTSKCYLTWDMDFKWLNSNDPYMPVISGGLLGLSNRWWHETGGYDRHMFGWGGENLDQSLRVWLCGGEIVASDRSQIAHMWRKASDGRTAAKYMRVGNSQQNRARAGYAWYGNFSRKLMDYNFYRFRSENQQGEQPWYGDLSNIWEVRDRLKCRPFAWLLQRFKHVYEDAGMIPEKVFMLKHRHSEKCLTYGGGDGTSSSGQGPVRLQDCDRHNDRQYWHPGNRDRANDGACCSGLRAWNTDQCIHTGSSTSVCEVSGGNWQQLWSLTSGGTLRRGNDCIVGKWDENFVWTPELGDCQESHSQEREWFHINAKVPIETQLYHEAQAENPAMFAQLAKRISDM